MSARIALTARIQQYLAERRRLGFELKSSGLALASFARYVALVRHRGPLTAEVMADWARQVRSGDRGAAARRLMTLRPFARWLQQFEPRTAVPDEPVFGPEPGRVAPHIYQDDEIVQLLAAAEALPPAGSLRSVTYQTLFGLLASSGLRISEALALRDIDVDLKVGVLTIRQTKFAKSRAVPVHPSTTQVLARYRQLRSSQVPTAADTRFFVGTRGRRRGQPLGDRQVHRIFVQLREQLGWINRGAHAAVRVHDLRHTFAVRRLIRWYEQGVDIDPQMLALSTYLGHVKISYTYWYLSGVPDLVKLAGARFERFAASPEPDHG